LSDPNEIVRRGYDAIADRYDEWAASFVVEEDWLGAPMFFASFPPETNRRLLREAGLRARSRPRRSPRRAWARGPLLHVGSGKIARLEVLDFNAERALAISRFGSRAANAVPLTLPDGEAHVVCLRLGPGGVLGRHPASVEQLFVVVDGEGWASGADGERVPVTAGTAIHWQAGEQHESGSESGLTAIVVESERLVPHLRDA
jgi:quercetin dioxygenase-like cupin family protein